MSWISSLEPRLISGLRFSRVQRWAHVGCVWRVMPGCDYRASSGASLALADRQARWKIVIGQPIRAGPRNNLSPASAMRRPRRGMWGCVGDAAQYHSRYLRQVSSSLRALHCASWASHLKLTWCYYHASSLSASKHALLSAQGPFRPSRLKPRASERQYGWRNGTETHLCRHRGGRSRVTGGDDSVYGVCATQQPPVP